MNNRLLDALMIVAESVYRAEAGTCFAPDETKKNLLEQGFSQDEAEKAVGWVSDRITTFRKGRKPLRVLSSFERVHLTTEGSGLLLKLRNLGLLTDEHIELIIARALLLDELPIDGESIRNMAFVLLFDLKNNRDGFSMYIDSDKSDVAN